MTDPYSRITADQLAELVTLSAQAGTDLDIDALLLSSDAAENAIHAYSAGRAVDAWQLLNENVANGWFRWSSLRSRGRDSKDAGHF